MKKLFVVFFAVFAVLAVLCLSSYGHKGKTDEMVIEEPVATEEPVVTEYPVVTETPVLEKEKTVETPFGVYSIPSVKYDDSVLVHGDTEEQFRERSGEEQFRFVAGHGFSETYLNYAIDSAEKGCAEACLGLAEYYFRYEVQNYGASWYWAEKSVNAGEETGRAAYLLGCCFDYANDDHRTEVYKYMDISYKAGYVQAAYYLEHIFLEEENYENAAEMNRAYVNYCNTVEAPVSFFQLLGLDDNYEFDYFSRKPEDEIKKFAGIWVDVKGTLINLYSNGYVQLGKIGSRESSGLWTTDNGNVMIRSTGGDLRGNVNASDWRTVLLRMNNDHLVYVVDESNLKDDIEQYDPRLACCSVFSRVSPESDDGISGYYVQPDAFAKHATISVYNVNGNYTVDYFIRNSASGNDLETLRDNENNTLSFQPDAWRTCTLMPVTEIFYKMECKENTDYDGDEMKVHLTFPTGRTSWFSRVATYW